MKINYKNILFRGLFVCAVMAFLFACKSNPQSPGIEYMPDMYRSPALEPYVSYPGRLKPGLGNPLKMYSRQPVEGTIPRGFVVYHLNASDSCYLAAGELLHNPLTLDKKILAHGKWLFDTYCAVCHGEKGDGHGTLTNAIYKNGVPNYADSTPSRRGGHSMKSLKDGDIFHVTTFGLNAMGSYASQITKKERWEIIAYVHTLQGRDPIKEQKARLATMTAAQQADFNKKSNYWENIEYQPN